MQRIIFTCLLALTAVATALAQPATKKALDHADLDRWKTIEKTQLSDDGRWISYELRTLEGDPELVLYDGLHSKEIRFSRAQDAAISADSRYLVFRIKPSVDTLREQRRRKVKKEDLPRDTLAVYQLANARLEKIPDLKSYYLPRRWSGWLAWSHEAAIVPESKSDTTKTEKKKKESAENGTRLIIRHLESGAETAVGYVTAVAMAERQPAFLLASTGSDSSFLSGVYRFNPENRQLKPIYTGKAKFKNLVLDEQGLQAAFLADRDTTKARIRPWDLYFQAPGQDSATLSVGAYSEFMPETWAMSEHGALRFSKDGSKLFFGIAPEPILQDTTLLDDEIVNVEVWRYDEPRLHTQQKVQLEQEKKRNYLCVLHTAEHRVTQLGDLLVPEIRTGNENNAPVALGFNEQPYLMETSWTGGPACRDVYVTDVSDGSRMLVQKGLCAVPALSPSAQYLVWYLRSDSAWYAYSITDKTTRQIAGNATAPFHNEESDTPALPGPYGIAAWGENDAFVLIYDRYDLWKIDPAGRQSPQRLSKGREAKKAYRYINPDPDKRFVTATDRLLLHTFEDQNKYQGYAWLELGNAQLRQIQSGAYTFERNPTKARNADKWLFTRENFQVFPDLLYSSDLVTFKQVSNANPQQKDYRWGTIERFEWTAADGQKLQGLLAKPEGFDPKKQYPMIVNFYERSSDGLYQHRAPAPHRSTINYTFYTSRGYLVFNPDVPYREGYPGESAFNSVISGTTSLIDKGFVDKSRIGLQGHSWGGYQGAYLITKTDLFRCAEIGAPVVNMISAYGGIRWESGVVRQFQYEQQQSRIAGSLWEYPLRYIENSPIFTMDKVNTPVLILHNDKDGAVPWYQGIEMFTALRRLGKPAWMLNYNDEPHWPVKLQNRKDFQRRMQQFFDHYLIDAPLPPWMERGVPAIEKGVRQGF
jgi:dipeptidyl aminopeptidase/acylaminoacyl peptidase